MTPWLWAVSPFLNSFIHTMLAIALVAASVMVLRDFIFDVVDEIHNNPLGVGFLRALGTLFLLWTMSALITAEIGYIRTGQFQLRVFIEVAMITLLRQLIIRPMQLAVGDTSMDWAGRDGAVRPGSLRSADHWHRPSAGWPGCAGCTGSGQPGRKHVIRHPVNRLRPRHRA